MDYQYFTKARNGRSLTHPATLHLPWRAVPGENVAYAKSASEKMATWFESARNAQDKLISGYSEEELEIIADAFEKFAKLWDDERKKVQKNQ